MATIEIEGQSMAISKAQARDLYGACRVAKNHGETVHACDFKFEVDAYVDEDLGQMYAIRKNTKRFQLLCLTEQGLMELRAYGSLA